MITVLETRDFFEGIFNSREELDAYFSNHPEKESCRIIERDFSSFPLYVLEIGRGNFKYFKDENTLVSFIRSINIHELPVGEAVVFYYCENSEDNGHEKYKVPSLTLYYISGPYKSFHVNEDGIGSLGHYHFDFEMLGEVIKSGSIKGISF